MSLICPENEFMPFLEVELRETLRRRMKKSHILFVHEPISVIDLEEDCIRVTLLPRVQERELYRRVLPERKLRVDLVLYSGGRTANTDALGCERVGIEIGKYGRVKVDDKGRTSSFQSVYAVGDVTGAGLASTAQQQGRKVSEILFGPSKQKGGPREDEEEDEGEGEGEEGEDSAMDVQVDEEFFTDAAPAAAEADSLFSSSSSDAPLTL